PLVDGPLGGIEVGEERAHARRAHGRAREQVRARDLALLDHRHRHLAQPLAQLRLPLEELHDPDRAGEAGRAGADDRDPDLDPLVLGVGDPGDEFLRRGDRRRKLRRSDAHQPPFLALIASVSLGTILWRSPTTPRSLNSKIGAFGSLLIARMFSEFCMPTLCWIAPEIPTAR